MGYPHNHGLKTYEPQATSGTLTTWQPRIAQELEGQPIMQVTSQFDRVKVVGHKRGQRKAEVLFYYGWVDQLNWDPMKVQWTGQMGQTPFMGYTTKLRYDLLREKHVVPNVVEKKWQGILPLCHRLRWNRIWSKGHTPKEVGLLWLVWHRAVAVNEWHGRIYPTIDMSCPVCPQKSHESVLHRFWECVSAQHAWQWGILIMYVLITNKEAHGPWCPLTWKLPLLGTHTTKVQSG